MTSVEPEVGVCMLTYKRPQQLIKALSWIKERTTYPNYKIYVIIDYESDSATLHTLKTSPFAKEHIEMFSSRAECVKATNRCYSIGKEPYFVYLSDDMEVTKGWLTKAMKCMQTFPDKNGLVVFKDGIQNGNNACAGLVSREYVRTGLGDTLFHPQYVHYCGDTELFRRSKLMDKVKYCPTSVVWHRHFQAQGVHKVAKDAVYTDSLPVWPGDRKILAERTQRGFK